MTKPLYFYNGSSFELVGPTTPQSPIAYQTSAPTAPATGDLWIDSDGDVDTYNRQLTRYYFVATAAQTTITGIDANGLTLAYVAGSEAVYVNGALQVRGQDYTATNGTSVVMSSGLAVNDVVEIFAYTAFTVANAYTKSETDGVAAAAAGLRMIVPTSIAVGSGSGSVDANGAITFSSATSVDISGAFSSAYDNYRIFYVASAVSAGDIAIRLGTGGSFNSTSGNYRYNAQYAVYTSATITGFNSSTTGTNWIIGNASGYGTIVDIYSPFAARNSAYTFQQARDDGGYMTGGGTMTVTTSYDQVRLIRTDAGSFSGIVRIYGYKN